MTKLTKEEKEFIRSVSLVKGEKVERLEDIVKKVAKIKQKLKPWMKLMKKYRKEVPMVEFLAHVTSTLELIIFSLPNPVERMAVLAAFGDSILNLDKTIAEAEKIKKLAKKFEKNET